MLSLHVEAWVWNLIVIHDLLWNPPKTIFTHQFFHRKTDMNDVPVYVYGKCLYLLSKSAPNNLYSSYKNRYE